MTVLLLAGCAPGEGPRARSADARPIRAAGGDRAPALSATAPSAATPSVADARRWAIGRFASGLPLAALAGQAIMIGIENDAAGRPLVALDDAHRRMLREVQPGAVVLFGQTFAGIEQVVALVRELHEGLAIAPIVATDYEGGLVSRLTSTGGLPATRIPPAAVVGRAMREAAAADPATGADSSAAGPAPGTPPGLALARDLGRVMGRELRALGVTMNFAPVADVDPPGATGAIGRHLRTFGDDPELVGAIAREVARGLEDAGVAAVVKHFPGHGGVLVDSHDALALLEADEAAIRSRDLRAFEIALAGRPAGIMTAHLAVPALGDGLTPATLSARLTALAREELGYDGLVVTDALNMRAITDLADERELAVQAMAAGADFLLKPIDPVAARDALVEAVETGRLARARLEEAAVRVFLAKSRLGIFGPGRSPRAGVPLPTAEQALRTLGADEHVALVEQIVGMAGGAQ